MNIAAVRLMAKGRFPDYPLGPERLKSRQVPSTHIGPGETAARQDLRSERALPDPLTEADTFFGGRRRIGQPRTL
jgi:hypothetical protein